MEKEKKSETADRDRLGRRGWDNNPGVQNHPTPTKL